MKRNVYRIHFRLTSGLSIGCGENVETDCDVLARRDGTPFIPGSSLAGVYRESVRRARGIPSQEGEDKELRDYFGYVSINRNSGKQEERDAAVKSRIAVYDANVANGHFAVSLRDNVALDSFKMAVDGAKFDREIVNAGTEFVTYFEETLDDSSDGMSAYAKDILRAWFRGQIRFGGKTSRGLGSVRVKDKGIHWTQFHFPEDRDRWAAFNMYDDPHSDPDAGWKAVRRKDVEESDAFSEGTTVLRLEMKPRGGVLIRQYSTEVGGADYAQMENYDPSKQESVPIIPGTTWAGAIRHRMEELLGEDPDKQRLMKDMKELFGYVDEKAKKKKKSVIRFSESQIRNYKKGQHDEPEEKIVRMNTTRNAIDRFTGGTVDQALFTTRAVYGGRLELMIELPLSAEDKLKQALAASLADLHEGFLSVGGETSVGRGLFEIKSVNGERLDFKDKDRQGELIYTKLMGILTGGKGA